MQRCEQCNDLIPPDAFRERICEPCEDEAAVWTEMTYDGMFQMGFLLPDETVHTAGDGSTDAVIETAHGPVRARVGQTFVRSPDGRVEVSG